MSTMKADWCVEDGYVGKSRPQHSNIDLADFEDCEGGIDYEMRLDELIQEDFDQQISWCCNNYTEIIEAAKLYNATEEE